jgi:tripartite-type tricarboxylate transporter receptor subunit TctC
MPIGGKRAFGLAAAIALCLAGATAARAADDAAAFYKGSTVTVLCPFGADGGYGRLVALVAQHLGRHIAGAPKSVPQFMPGAGGIIMANYLYNAAPHDGSVIGLLYDNIPTVQLLYADKGVKYKSENFVALGSVGRYDPGVIGVRPDSPALSIAAAKKKVDVIGAGGRGTNQFIVPNLLNKLVGTKFKIVTGYKALGEMMLAMERNEVQGTLGSLSFFKETRPDWIRDGKIKWIVQLADRRDPELKDVPLLQETTDNKQYQAVFIFITRARNMTKALVAPPGIPKARAAALRRAILDLTHDKAFLADAKRQRLDVAPGSWKKVQKLMRDTVHTDPAVVRLTRKMTAG